MRYDLLAGAMQPAFAPMMTRAPTILIFDSGVGGLTVFSEIRTARPDARFVYAADDAAFPYGRLGEEALRARVVAVMERLIARHAPDAVVIACNTASTIALPALRAAFAIPFIGTVPAVKPAAAASRSRVVAVLATPGTVERDYTRELVASFAADCEVVLVGSTRLASIAEAVLRGETVHDREIAREIAPCFVERQREDGAFARTDVVVLACTHYPLLLQRFEALAPWAATWIDPAPAIARRVIQLLGPAPEISIDGEPARAVFTSGALVTDELRRALAERGLAEIDVEPMALTFG